MIIAHEKITNLLDRQIKEGRLSAAYIFSGPENVGKFTCALNFTGKIIGKEPSEMEDNFILLRPEEEEIKGVTKKKDIKVESIREIQHRLGLSVSKKGHKVLIIDEADRLNKAAQNALLKTLEEPRPGVIIILIVQNEKYILPTVFSRCQRLKFGLASEAQILKNIPPETKNKEAIVFWSFGRVGKMKDFLNGKEDLDFYTQTFGQFRDIFSREIDKKLILAEKLSQNVPELTQKINLWIMLLRLTLLGESEKIKISQSRSLRAIENLSLAAETIKNTNVNVRLVLENVFLEC